MSASRLYERFHGHPVRWRRGKGFHVPHELVVLGRAVAVEYECDKRHGGGDGHTAVYRHEFETPSYVCADERGRGQLYIIGGRLIVTDAGIER
jgi:hypothetical protein